MCAHLRLIVGPTPLSVYGFSPIATLAVWATLAFWEWVAEMNGSCDIILLLLFIIMLTYLLINVISIQALFSRKPLE